MEYSSHTAYKVTPHEANYHLHDHDFIGDIADHLPLDFLQPVLKKYSSIYGDSYNGKSRRLANNFLLACDQARQSGHTRILLSDCEAIKLKASRFASLSKNILHSKGYEAVVSLLSDEGISEPVSKNDSQEGKESRVKCEIWWARQLTKQSERESELFAIKSGLVCRGVSNYVSKALLLHYQAKQKNSFESLSNMEAVNSDTGEVVSLVDILKGSMSNPELRRIELMVRCRGFEEYSTENGHTAAFYTITAPSKFHASMWNSARKKSFENKKYNGSSPKETQAYLVGLWAKIRSKLKRDGLNVYGFRVCEPHHDGTPHWHLLLFMKPEIQSTVTQIMRSYAMAEDGDERGAEKHRFTVELIDKNKGSATGYIAKYISKNINGMGISQDFESGEAADSSSDRVRTWASLWGIRQFQMIGGAPVGVWRELRRMDEAPEGLISDAMEAAIEGNWKTYLQLQGGADVNRKDQSLRCYSIECYDPESGETLINQYGEPVYRVKGIELSSLTRVQTRIHQWTIQHKNPDSLALQREAPRSTLNNCTQLNSLN